MKVRVGGVPEHFNLAWHLAIEQKQFSAKGIDIDWKDVPGGTGAMCNALRLDELDIAIALTEGVVSDVMKGNPSRIVQFYVNSPLTWGIYVNAQSDIHHTHQMAGKQYAISRYQSGSHLMAYVHAKQTGLALTDQDFVVVGNLEGAREALRTNAAQLFMWEKFTTKPYVDSGEYRKIGECRTPWPCFVIAVRQEFIEKHETVLTDILSIINLSCLVLKNNSEAPALIAQRYGIKPEDAMEWFAELEYAYHPEMNEQQMLGILKELKALHIIDRIPALTDICYEKNIEQTA
jgi:ABC-type nitrate/sulfonate/bicarbonate transport system substrate-binding protein